MPLLFFQVVLVTLDHFSTDLYRKGGCARIAATASRVLSRDAARIIRLGLLVFGTSNRPINWEKFEFERLQHLQLLLNRDCAGKKVKQRSCRWPPTLHDGQLHSFRFRRVANLLALRAALMPLVRVPWCHNCSSKLCLQVGTCETRSPQLMRLCKN